jgi:hypothetical protein
MTALARLALLGMLAAAPAVPAWAADDAAPATEVPAPPAGKGEVVFFRSGTIMGSAISCAVHENDAKLSSLPPGHYAVIVADPGKHAYAVRSEATDTLNVQVESGEIQYVSCHVKMGIMAGRPVLTPATAEEFKGKKYKLVEPDKNAKPTNTASTSAPAAPAASAQR